MTCWRHLYVGPGLVVRAALFDHGFRLSGEEASSRPAEGRPQGLALTTALPAYSPARMDEDPARGSWTPQPSPHSPTELSSRSHGHRSDSAAANTCQRSPLTTDNSSGFGAYPGAKTQQQTQQTRPGASILVAVRFRQ